MKRDAIAYVMKLKDGRYLHSRDPVFGCTYTSKQAGALWLTRDEAAAYAERFNGIHVQAGARVVRLVRRA